MNNVFTSADILIPKGIDLQKWSVVACDQYTSEPHYWDRVEKFVDENYSTLNLIFPEIYLETVDFDEKIALINDYMSRYINEDIFSQHKDSILYIERTDRVGNIRKGLIGAFDLECYDYTKGVKLAIRATEGTVLDRIPPRVRIRKDAPLEIPHIMVLIDDKECDIIEKISDRLNDATKVYDFDLMQDSGSIKGYKLSRDMQKELLDKLDHYSSKEEFMRRYNLSSEHPVLSYAVGDGNHSLATAKKCYENLKSEIGEDNAKNHPARYALAELVNVHSDALEFEAIHRIVFKVDPQNLIEELKVYFDISKDTSKQGQKLTYVIDEVVTDVVITNPKLNLTVGSLTEFLDKYTKENGGVVDYIHGSEVVKQLSKTKDSIGFILESMEKSDLFKTVIFDDALPRKTFSMGHAWDKRFYLEARMIK